MSAGTRSGLVVADTSVFIAEESGRPVAVGALERTLAVSIVTVGELRVGVLAASDVETRGRRLATLTRAQSLTPLPVDGPVADAWARLRVELRAAGVRLPVNDSWIAATALAAGVAVMTQDDDYDAAEGISGLAIVKV